MGGWRGGGGLDMWWQVGLGGRILGTRDGWSGEEHGFAGWEHPPRVVQGRPGVAWLRVQSRVRGRSLGIESVHLPDGLDRLA